MFARVIYPSRYEIPELSNPDRFWLVFCDGYIFYFKHMIFLQKIMCAALRAGKSLTRFSYTYREFHSTIGIFALLVLFACATTSAALPWDQDLFKQESFKANEMARAPVPGTVAVGAKPFTMTPDEAAVELKNPTPVDANSLARGKRLWNVNCLPCHGSTGDSQGVPAGPLMGAPSLLSDFYKAREDGRIFATIHLGGANMPAYGFKINHDEKWDIINYLRRLQGLN